MYQALPKFLHVKDSPIAGQGLFAKNDVPADVYLGVSHVVVGDLIPNIMRTPLGGFVNHSDDANCIKECQQKDWGQIWHMKTIKDIKAGEELFLKYTFYSVDK
tara:strand:+ start:789 stop:1097 length:309 start_codon:yes stop_codon:yes gene_type:complete